MFENKGDIRNSIKAIIINNNKILLTHNEYGGEQFYLLPGGGQNHGETIIDALKRECLEEVNSSVDVLRLRFIREYIGKNHQFASEDSDVHQVELMFECRLIDDNLKLTENKDDFQIGFEWIDLNNLKDIKIYPSILKEVISSEGEFSSTIYLGDEN